ncbi:hypothetical protein AT302_08155 [Pandoraea norimbergensis]|uniref:Uncharacterized protein n=1 Tax=Pandoraea norimbergensis TaxID=93219 RepID=A0ABN4JFJ6_9BURK|nr:hypothetical protein AT302_08155 [Pandoraea norimbergensis]
MRLDAEHRHREDDEYPEVITFGGNDSSGAKAVASVLRSSPNPTIAVLERLTKPELAYIMALMYFGRGDAGDDFQRARKLAAAEMNATAVLYLAQKPLSKYLPDGIERLKRLGL